MRPSGYQLLSLDDGTLTEAGKELLAIKDERVRHEALAAHILKRLNGMNLLQPIRVLLARGEAVTKATLHRELERHGIDMPRATVNHLRAIAWLRKGGVIAERGYDIDEEAVERLTRMSLRDVEGWASLTSAQAAFLRTLRRMAEVHQAEEQPVKAVIDQAVYEHGRLFSFGPHPRRSH